MRLRPLLLILFVLTGCWPWPKPKPKPTPGTSPSSNWWKHQRDLEQTGYELASMGPNPQQLWATPLVTGTTSLTAPAFGVRHVFIGSGYGDGKLYALLRQTGAVDWTFSAHPNNGFFGAAAAANDAVYIASKGQAPHVYAVRAGNGSLIWQTPLPGVGSSASVSVAFGRVYVNTDQHRVYALDQFTGAIVWSAPTSTGTSSEESSPGVGFGRVYVGSDNGIYAFNATTGAASWTYPLTSIVGFSSAVVHMNVPTGSPALVLIGTGDYKLHAVQAVTGTGVWVYNASATLTGGTVAVAHGKVFLFDYTSVTALDANTGAVVWTQAKPNIPRDSPAIARLMLFYRDERSIHGVDVNTGATVWSASIPGNGNANAPGNSPAMAGEILVVPNKGHVYAFR